MPEGLKLNVACLKMAVEANVLYGAFSLHFNRLNICCAPHMSQPIGYLRCLMLLCEALAAAVGMKGSQGHCIPFLVHKCDVFKLQPHLCWWNVQL